MKLINFLIGMNIFFGIANAVCVYYGAGLFNLGVAIFCFMAAGYGIVAQK